MRGEDFDDCLCSRCAQNDDTGTGLCQKCWLEDFPPESDIEIVDESEGSV